MFAYFCAFESVMIPGTMLELWTGHPPTPGMLMGTELPVSDEVMYTSLFLAAFSAVSFAAASVNDPRVRESFFDPLLREVTITITARNLYDASDAVPEESTSPAS